MSLKIEKVNNVKIEVPQIKKKKDNFKGDHIFDIEYFCLTILGKRKSGKTVLIYNLLKNFLTKKMIVLFFVPTFHKDDTYEPIRNMLKKMKITYEAYSSFVEDGINILETFMDVNNGYGKDKEQKEQNKDAPPELKDIEPCKFYSEQEKKEMKKKKRKKKDQPPEYFIVTDDNSGYLRKPEILKLIKNSRHFKTKIVISTQAVSDVHPHVFAQMDYLALFKDFNEDSLDFLYSKLQLRATLEEFKVLYHFVTGAKTKEEKDKRNFILINLPTETYYINLNKKIVLSDIPSVEHQQIEQLKDHEKDKSESDEERREKKKRKTPSS